VRQKQYFSVLLIFFNLLLWMNPGVFVYLEFLRKTLLPLPGVTEKICFWHTRILCEKKIFTRIKEDGENLAILGTLERDKWMQACNQKCTI
jgi:hypothetical protein